MEIVKKVQLSPDTYRFTFKFNDPEWLMGLPLANHMIFFMPAQAEGQDPVARKYTPVSPMTQKGEIDYVIKCYPNCEEFPNGGKMGHYLKTKEVGDKIMMEGPVGRATYKGNGLFKIKTKGDKNVTKIGLLAGGSGITPLFSVMDAIHRGKDSTITQCSMIYSNKTEADILIREQLDAINADASAPHLKVTHTLTRAAEDVAAENVTRGRVNIEMLRSSGFPEPAEDVGIMICGPKGFNEACKALLLANGYTDSMLV